MLRYKLYCTIISVRSCVIFDLQISMHLGYLIVCYYGSTCLWYDTKDIFVLILILINKYYDSEVIRYVSFCRLLSPLSRRLEY